MRILFQLIAVHCGSLRQTAQIQSMSQECLRTGDKALVHFRFIKHPEYIKPGLRLVITITDLIVFNRVKCLLCWFN